MTEKIMRPIRQTEMDYWNFTIDSEYDNRKNSLKSEMVDEINDIADTNYPKFMKALKIDKLTKEVQKLYKDYHKFKSEKELIELELKRKLMRYHEGKTRLNKKKIYLNYFQNHMRW